MSTTFDIFPIETDEISFGQVLLTSERNINAFLKSIGIEQLIRLEIELYDKTENCVKEIQMTDKFEWTEKEYVWIAINGIAGGTDGYCSNIKSTENSSENPWWQLKELELSNTTVDNIKEKLEKVKKLNRHWSFRRSAGQPAIIALSYGLISASVAELTNGLVWTDDGAWDYDRFPAESEDFINWYFRPDQALNADKATWSKKCIEGIIEEFNAPNSTLPKVKRTWLQKLFSK